MSSAKRQKPSLEEQEQISLMFKRKSSGPSTEPRGTPQTMLEESEVWDYAQSFFYKNVVSRPRLNILIFPPILG